jgi:serine/threonine protein kinase
VQVYQAVLTNTQELVAVKQIRHDHHVCVPGSVTREIVHMKLLCHDNICRYTSHDALVTVLV